MPTSLKYRAIVLAGRRAIGIHQTRVALRRLRAALGLFRGAVDGPTEGRIVRALAAEAKWLAGECAPARDLHVFLTETAEDVPPEVKRIATRLARLHYDRARTALSGARYNGFDGQLTAFVQAAPAAPSTESPARLEDFGRALLERRHAKVERRGQHFRSLDHDELHQLRIAIKKLRYAAGFLRPAFASEGAKAYIEATSAPAGRARCHERPRGGRPDAGRHRRGGPPVGRRRAAAAQSRQAGRVRRQASGGTSSGRRGSGSRRPSASGG